MAEEFSLYQTPEWSEADDVTRADLLSPTDLNGTIDQNLPIINDRLGFTTTGYHSFEFENLVKLNRFLCDFDRFHKFKPSRVDIYVHRFSLGTPCNTKAIAPHMAQASLSTAKRSHLLHVLNREVPFILNITVLVVTTRPSADTPGKQNHSKPLFFEHC